MKKKLISIVSIVLVLALAAGCVAAFAGCGENPNNDGETKKLTFGLITLHDDTSTYDKNFIDAARDVCAAEGVSLIIRSNIPEEGSDCYDTALDLVDQGCDIVFADSFGHESNMIAAAKECPNVQFCHATGTMAHTEKLANFHNAFAAIYEGRYLAGVAAGMKLTEMINSGEITASEAVIGYIGAYSYAEVKSGYTSFYLGAKEYCPSATMKVLFTNSWFSPNREKEAANTLISEGCVLMSQHADSYGAPNACKEAGIPDVTYNLSTQSQCPDSYLAGSKINWRIYFKHIIDAVKNNDASLKTEYDWTGTVADGSVEFIALNESIAAEGTQAVIDELVESFKKGEIKVFDTSKFTAHVVDTGDWATSKNLNATVDENYRITAYQADVNSDPNYAADTQVIKTEGDKTFFSESSFRSAPYFDADIDGITILGNNADLPEFVD